MSAYKRYLLIILLVTLAFNAKDRLLFGLALQDIKSDLGLSDTQLGLLSGIAFSLFYSVMGIPIARWADRGDRVLILGLCTAGWSAAVALCAMAANFVQLLLLRVGVAIGEAGCVPTAHSLIADHFTREERPYAVSIFKLGNPLSALIAFFLGGWLIELYGWRSTFVILGLPGVFLAVVIWASLREPRREKPLDSDGNVTATKIAQPSLWQVFLTLWGIRAFRHLLIAFSIMAFFANGVSQWQPAFFMRSFGMGPRELGLWFTIIYGAFGIVGTVLGGVLATRYAAGNEGLQLRAVAAAYCFYAVMTGGIYLSSDPYVALLLIGVSALGTSAASGPLFATVQTLTPPAMRAVGMAIVLLFVSLVGLGLGPLGAGMLSDALRAAVGEESLRYALLAFSPGYFWSAWHFWKASRTVAEDLEGTGGVRTRQSAPAT